MVCVSLFCVFAVVTNTPFYAKIVKMSLINGMMRSIF